MLNEPYSWKWHIIAAIFAVLFIIVAIIAFINTRWRNYAETKIKRIENTYTNISNDKLFAFDRFLEYMEKFLVDHYDPMLGNFWTSHLDFFLFEGIKNKFRDLLAAQWATGNHGEIPTSYEYKIRKISEICKKFELISNPSAYPAYKLSPIVRDVCDSKRNETLSSCLAFLSKGSAIEKVKLICDVEPIFDNNQLAVSLHLYDVVEWIMAYIRREIKNPNFSSLAKEGVQVVLLQMTPVFERKFFDEEEKKKWRLLREEFEEKNKEAELA